MIILGVDPSSTSTGFGLIDCHQRRYRYVACGCLRPPSGLGIEDRLVFLYDKMTEIVVKYSPTESAVESTFVGPDAQAVTKLGQVRGVLLLALRKAGLPIAHFTPAQVKKAIAGNGQAKKDQVRFMMVRMLGLAEIPRPLDASDALAVAMCQINQQYLHQTALQRPRRPEVQELLFRMKT